MNKEQTENMLIIVNNSEFKNQLEQAVEEASEFILAVQKCKRYPDSTEYRHNLIDETADLLIITEQMREYLGTWSVDCMIDYKLERQIARISDIENGRNCSKKY